MTVSAIFNATGTYACVLLLKIEINQINYLGFKTYIANIWNAADLSLIMVYLGAYLPLNYLQEIGTVCHYAHSQACGPSYEWKLVNFILIMMTFVKINQSLKIFDSFSFLVQMVQSVFYDLRLFLAYYIMVITTFGFLLMVIFDEPNSDSEGLGSASFIIMSLRIVWGEGSFDIEKSQYKFMAWMTYVLLMLCGNIVFMNFLIAVVNQSYEACMMRMQSQALKAKLYLIRDYYLTLPQEAF
jgi:hypothetical protein